MGLAPGRPAIRVRDLARAAGWLEETYGESVEGVPLRVLLPPGRRPERLLYAAIHGEEAPTLMLAWHLLRGIDASRAVTAVVPVANPDGVLHGTRQNARGIDLNRNWPASTWRPDVQPTFWPTTRSRTPEHRTQHSSPGGQPASEPEVTALMELIQRLEPRVVIDLHAPLNVVIAQTPGAVDLATHVAEPAGLRVVRELRTPTWGDAGTWIAEQGIDSITYEIETGPFPALWARHRDGLARTILPLPG